MGEGKEKKSYSHWGGHQGKRGQAKNGAKAGTNALLGNEKGEASVQGSLEKI